MTTVSDLLSEYVTERAERRRTLRIRALAVAQEAGLPVNTVYRIEAGRGGVSPGRVSAYCAALDALSERVRAALAALDALPGGRPMTAAELRRMLAV
jgi:hypothetical protein